MISGRLAASALFVAAASSLVAGCSHGSNYGAFEDACEKQVGAATVGEWQETHDDAPWDVTKVTSTKSKEGSESSSESKVVYVSGTASVEVDEGGADTRDVSWSCFSQQPEGDTSVSAAIRSITIG